MKTKKTFFFMFVMLNLFQQSFFYSQNLVPNPSFENILNCDSLISGGIWSGDFPPWESPTDGTPDGFNTCDNTSMYGSPSNDWGFQHPHSGNGYIGGGLYSVINGLCENSQVQLTSPLVANEHYCVSFYVSLANRSKYACNNIGMYFSNAHTYIPGMQYLNVTPQIIDTNIITDTLNWKLIYGEFVAQGGEQYIIIGRFYSNPLTDTSHVSGGVNWGYYYIDDVNVHCCTCDSINIGVEEQGTDKRQWAIMPNPSSGEWRVNLNKEYKNIEIEIADMLGQKVYATKVKETNLINLTLNIPPGLYFVSLIADDRKQVMKLVKE